MSRINVLHSRDQVHVIISVSTCLYINDKITRCVAVCAETICVYMKSKVCWLIFTCSHQIMNHIHWFSVILLHLMSLFYFSVDEDQCVQVWIRSGSITTQVIYHLNKGLNDDSKQLFIIRRRRWWVVMFWVNCSFKQTSVLPAFFPVLRNPKHLKRKLLWTETLMGNGKLHCFLLVGASSSSRNRLHSPSKDMLRVWSWWWRRCASSATFHVSRIPRLDWEWNGGRSGISHETNGDGTSV